MDPRTVETWVTIMGRLPAPQSAELAIAQRIIGDLVGYHHKSYARTRDVQELANALQAYARLLQQHGVTA